MRFGPMSTSSGAGTVKPPVLLVLPGSRRSEISHHMAVFGETLGLAAIRAPFEAVLPTMPHLQDVGSRGREELAGAAADRRRRAGKEGGIPDRARGFRQIGHRDARARARRGADGRRLQGRRRRGLDLRTRDPRQSVILANLVIGENVVPEFLQRGLHAGETGAGVARRPRRYAVAAATDSRPLPDSTPSCRPAASRPACEPPISCWRRCERRGDPIRSMRWMRADRIHPRSLRTNYAITCACRYRRNRDGRRRYRAGAAGRSSAADPRSSRSTG